MGRARAASDKEIAAALIKAGGLVSFAVKEIKKATGKDIARTTIINRCNLTPALQALRTTAKEEVLDYAEQGLFAAVKAKHPWAIKFVLSRIGKERGYTTTFKVDAHVESSGKVVIMLPANNRDKPDNG